MWAFWFAVAHYLSHLHPSQTLYAYEKDSILAQSLRDKREHAYFFPWARLCDNVVIIDDLVSHIRDTDIIIIVVPVPYIRDLVATISPYIQSGTLIINCSKWIDNTTLQTVSDIVSTWLWDTDYNYAVLSGGMIASELVALAPLGATIGISDTSLRDTVTRLFQSTTLDIDISTQYRDVELFGSLKNIFALYAGYLEGQWHGLSGIWYSLIGLYRELPLLISQLWWSSDIDFASYALGGDLIATCFGESRNRYFGRIVWSGRTAEEAREVLRQEKKHAEGYETLMAIAPIIQSHNLPRFQEVMRVFLR